MNSVRERALTEKALCETILAKDGLSVLSETLRGVDAIGAWDHYPPGDVFDPASNAQWYYHCHPAEEGSPEHGHFHCFMRPSGPQGPIHHLAALGVDAEGQLRRIFTVNQWVVGDDWADAGQLIELVSQFDVQMPRPSYLVNRWLTSIMAGYEEAIADLIRARERILQAHQPPQGVSSTQDRALEVTSEFLIDAN
jgi:hypothetical protein